MQLCKNCSAPTMPGARVCGYCGAVILELVSAKEEILALSELSSLAIKLDKRKAAHLWKHAFIPTTLEAQVAALTQALSLLQKTTMMGLYKGYTSLALGVFGSAFRTPDINTIALSRCDAILTAMRLASAMEPQASAQVDLAEREVERAKEGLAASKLRVAKMVGWSILVYFGFIGLAMFGLSRVNSSVGDISFDSYEQAPVNESGAKISDGKHGHK